MTVRAAVCGLLMGYSACADVEQKLTTNDASVQDTPGREQPLPDDGKKDDQTKPPVNNVPDASKRPADAASPASTRPDADTARPSDAGIVDASATTDASDASLENQSDRCEVAKLDTAHRPETIPLSGSLGTHDPTAIESNGVYYSWNTGPRLPAKTSVDLRTWKDAPSAFGTSNPAWVAKEVPGATDLWAPDVSYFGGMFHLYYSASTFSSNSSCIGHATRPSLEQGSWADKGPVVCSNHGTKDDWNAIDPNAFSDVEGKHWLTFGSFWSGIKAIELDSSGARVGDRVYSLATRPPSVDGAIEAPILVRRCGYYYLFASFDKCCVGNNSTYNIRVGRAKSVLGPFVDADGVSMLKGGGTLVVKGDSRYHGPGHNTVIFSGERAYNFYHAYDGQQNGRAVLRVAGLAWNDEGWPVSGGP
jgi:arabinan endo-1,5-alpha-L-arabinosidase